MMVSAVIDGVWRPCVGDRVRVRASVGRSLVCVELAHHVEEAGHVGTIVAVAVVASAPAHPYLVRFDAVRLGARLPIVGRTPLGLRPYVADELEPIE